MHAKMWIPYRKKLKNNNNKYKVSYEKKQLHKVETLIIIKKEIIKKSISHIVLIFNMILI